MDALFRLYEGLALLAPGDEETSRAALRRVMPLPPGARVLDVGAGTGRSARMIASAVPDAEVVAIDVHVPFLEEAMRDAPPSLRTRVESMDALSDPDESVDLIWSEGAAYVMGFESALRSWRRVVKPGAHAVVSELCWLRDERTDTARAFWAEAYPDMTDVEGARCRAENAGFAVIETIVLPERAWDAYYAPLEARCDALAADPSMNEAIESARREIALWRATRGEYGYVLFVAARVSR
ncbi:class I SAM-dependent methyltransferase [Sandaracinus amylolyticus]|uniref:Putative transcription regulator n=1 Tax=Sandaracinus amylolyticus TaxID=927083 RepID=A0A0F6YLW1_9BACT|nr:class I SAM-dependent methyltransferase [Sandaracinus amylolyticus]AKF10366.1 putative transcription regulator [Sandaracinus amylolyticus]